MNKASIKSLCIMLMVLFGLSCMGSLSMQAKNTKTSVQQLTTIVTVNEDVDYVITGATPFDGDGLVNITNTEHAVLILERVKPSKAISSVLSKRVQINGVAARDGQNCQVRLYGTMGCMILPYSSTDKPLTVYAGQNFTGDACNDFGLENDGGYMVSLSDAKLNNRIRSFKLKRGYMVTFATRKGGYGYQRCFIANDQDLEMATLPQILDGTISSYRIFRWNTAGKKGLASSTDGSATDALNVISCYDWGVGHDMLPDVECVANHLYEDYPTSSACGKATWTCHIKTNNEPRNSADDQPQSLSTILDNWQNLMRTGMRLCSPSSWDGSDNTDGSGFIKQFLDSIDARGWRCDIVDLHCYWLVDVFDKIGTMQSKYKRPIWISEWVWGASWNHNGAFESGKTKWDNQWAVQTICNKLNNMGYVERYFYWNSEESVSRIYEGGALTPAGEWYANQQTGLGYNSKYEKIPNKPRMRGGFRDFRVNTADGTATITWHEYDGEYNQVMELLRKEPGSAWETWKVIRPEDGEADYRITDDTWTDGVRYRLHIRSFSGRDYYSSQDMEAGEAINTGNGQQRYVGGNVIANGQFRMGLFGWTNGEGKPIAQPWFEVFPQSLSDGYFLQAFGNQGKDGGASLKTVFDIVPQQDYVLRMAHQNAGDYLKLDVRKKGESTDANKVTLKNSTYWTTQQSVFNSGDCNEALLAFRWLGGTAQMGDIELCRLFDTRKEAIADGVAKARDKAQAVIQWNSMLPELNTELEMRTTALPGNDGETLADINLAINDLLQAVADKQTIDSLLTVALAISDMEFGGRQELLEAIQTAKSPMHTAMDYADARAQLQQALNQFLTWERSATQPQSATFANATGWKTIAGTFTGGDQRTATQQDKTCWNAWWSGIDAEQGTTQTMEIKQTIGGLAEGLYSLECKASTQHYCLSDQHGYLTSQVGGETGTTPALSRDYLDIPNTLSAWQTLTSTPVYIAPGDSLIIGFTGSKQGATDNAWHRYGKPDEQPDKREGWWCATDFRLLYHPILKMQTAVNEYGTLCLPYTFTLTEGIKLFRIAGLSADYQSICLEEADMAEAGMPYIYMSDKANTTFYFYGEAERYPQVNELRGYFTSVANRVPAGCYELRDGEWYRITDTNRPYPTVYSAFIRPVKDLAILSEWDGPTMPIHGVTDELGEPDGIQATKAATQSPDVYYLMDGRQTNKKPAGLHIEMEGKQARKVFSR